jgi:succinate dehydrogenase/fumarate reductase flavoprotein subunit
MDRRVEVRTTWAVESLVVDDGVVVGVALTTPDGPRTVAAVQGVVLATGGFEWNEAMVQAFIGMALHPLSPPTNQGDGHRMAMAAGAGLANMGSHWGQPAVAEPGFVHDGQPLVQMASFRSAPGVVVVNRHGQRFVNEGATYQDFPKVLHTYDPAAVDYPNQPPTWAVFDQAVKDRTVILPSVLPGSPAPDWIHSSDSLAGLARAIGVDAEALAATVARWNAQVEVGSDPDHHRGTTRFESHMSGRLPVESDLLAPVSSPPFYAVELKNGTLGTNGGLRIDADGRVLDWAGSPIPGLYAAGNVTASVFGPAYPGGGATIGPAMTFGYLAGRHASSRERPPST